MKIPRRELNIDINTAGVPREFILSDATSLTAMLLKAEANTFIKYQSERTVDLSQLGKWREREAGFPIQVEASVTVAYLGFSFFFTSNSSSSAAYPVFIRGHCSSQPLPLLHCL